MNWRRKDPGDIPGLLELGIELHGHLGPFLVLGIRMGCLALRVLGHPGYRGIEAEVEVPPGPPFSCLVDGIQVSTGCTVGKGNLRVRPGRGVATFRVPGRAIRISLRDGALEGFAAAEDPEAAAGEALDVPEEEIFIWEQL